MNNDTKFCSQTQNHVLIRLFNFEIVSVVREPPKLKIPTRQLHIASPGSFRDAQI